MHAIALQERFEADRWIGKVIEMLRRGGERGAALDCFLEYFAKRCASGVVATHTVDSSAWRRRRGA